MPKYVSFNFVQAEVIFEAITFMESHSKPTQFTKFCFHKDNILYKLAKYINQEIDEGWNANTAKNKKLPIPSRVKIFALIVGKVTLTESKTFAETDGPVRNNALNTTRED